MWCALWKRMESCVDQFKNGRIGSWDGDCPGKRGTGPGRPGGPRDQDIHLMTHFEAAEPLRGSQASKPGQAPSGVGPATAGGRPSDSPGRPATPRSIRCREDDGEGSFLRIFSGLEPNHHHTSIRMSCLERHRPHATFGSSPPHRMSRRSRNRGSQRITGPTDK